MGFRVSYTRDYPSRLSVGLGVEDFGFTDVRDIGLRSHQPGSEMLHPKSTVNHFRHGAGNTGVHGIHGATAAAADLPICG